MHGDNGPRSNTSSGQGNHERQNFSKWTGCNCYATTIQRQWIMLHRESSRKKMTCWITWQKTESLRRSKHILLSEKTWAIAMLLIWLIRSIGPKLLGKWIREQDVSTNLFSQKYLYMALPINGGACWWNTVAASVDTGCSRTHMSRSVCCLWRKRGG